MQERCMSWYGLAVSLAYPNGEEGGNFLRSNDFYLPVELTQAFMILFCLFFYSVLLSHTILWIESAQFRRKAPNSGSFVVQVLKEILREIDSTLTEDDLENIIEEVDEDGSGTMDFDEFQAMMMG